MRRLRNDLLDIYWWMIRHNCCPCALGRWTPDWASLLCHRLDEARWRYRSERRRA